MIQSDYEAFLATLSKTAAYYGRSVNDDSFGIYWGLLKNYSLDEVQKAIASHCSDNVNGKFFPLVAHIIEQLQRHDGRLGADEAWAIVPKTENDSAVWTDEMSEAYFLAALPLLESGDEIAARMAFRSSYDRILTEARKRGMVARWTVTLGLDKGKHQSTLQDAVDRNRLPVTVAQQLLSHVDFSAVDDQRKLK